MQGDDRLRNIIGELSAPTEPSPEQRDEARAALHAAMAAEGPAPRSWWRRPALGWASAATAAAVMAGVLLLPGSTPEVDANLADIARAARAVPASQLPDGAFVFFHTEQRVREVNETSTGATVSYWLTTVTDDWVRGATQAVQLRVLPPEFDTEADSVVYYASNLPASDGVGETTRDQFTGINEQANIASLATDVELLREQILDELRQDPEFTEADEITIAGHVVGLLNPRFNAPPELRAALLEILGSLDVETTVLDADRVRVTLFYRQNGALDWQQDYEFDAAGFLRRDRLILLDHAPGLNLEPGLKSDVRYSPPEVVPGAFFVPSR